MKKNSLNKHMSFPFHLGFPGQPWPSPRDAAMSCVLSTRGVLECPRGETLSRRRTAKVISPSPLLSFWRKELPGACHIPREPPEPEKGGQRVYLQVEIGAQYIAWKCYQGALRGTKNLWLCPKKAQAHLCYTVLGITKVSRWGGNQVPFPSTHLFENPMFTALHLTVESGIYKVHSIGLRILMIFSSS